MDEIYSPKALEEAYPEVMQELNAVFLPYFEAVFEEMLAVLNLDPKMLALMLNMSDIQPLSDNIEMNQRAKQLFTTVQEILPKELFYLDARMIAHFGFEVLRRRGDL